MAKAWPKVWPTAEAARDWLKPRANHKRGKPYREYLYRTLPACGRYQLPGPRQKWRTFRYAPDVVPDPRAWLTARLGPLAGFELAEPSPAHCGLPVLDALFDAAAVVRESSGGMKPRPNWRFRVFIWANVLYPQRSRTWRLQKQRKNS